MDAATPPLPRLTSYHYSQGVGVLSLLETWNEWVHRRVEHVTLSDPVSSTRRISLDFTLAPNPLLPTASGDSRAPTYLVPVTLLEKRRITRFSLRDESQDALPILIRTQTAEIATAVLAEAAADAYESHMSQVEPNKQSRKIEPIPKDILKDLWFIAASKRREAVKRWGELGAPPQELSRAKKLKSRAWRTAMLQDDEFVALSYDLARNFLLLTLLKGHEGSRRIIKLSFEEQRLDSPISSPQADDSLARKLVEYGQQFLRFLGLRAKTINVPATGVGRAQCYHLEVEVPEGIRLTQAELCAFESTNAANVGGNATPQLPEAQPRRKHLTDTLRDTVLRSGQRIHLHLNDVPRAFTGTGTLHLRIGNGLILRGACINALFTTVLLALVAVTPGPFEHEPGSAVAILLGIPGGVSLYLARPREPGMSTSMHAGVRILAVGNALAAFAAAGLVLVGEKCVLDAKSDLDVCTPREVTHPALIASAAVAGFLLILLLAAYHHSRRSSR